MTDNYLTMTFRFSPILAGGLNLTAEVGIYKRKQESKKTRNKNSTKKVIKKKRKVFFLGRFLG